MLHRIAPLALALAIAAPSSADPPVNPDVFGIGLADGGWLLLDPAEYPDSKYKRMAEAGCKSTRMGASWPDIEPTRYGGYDWSMVENDVLLCEKYGIEPYCLIVNTPDWASPTGDQTHEWPPRADCEQDFRDFCYDLAARYAGRIKYYEFWNEENGYGWHNEGGTSFNHADEYVPWLRRCYQEMHAADPNCIVSVGGLDDPDVSDAMGWRAAYYMNLVYYYRDLWYPGEEIFDAVATHPYAANPYATLGAKLHAVHDVLLAHGEGDKPIWLTEYGWNLDDDWWNEAWQAQKMQEWFNVLLQPQYNYVTAAHYLAIADTFYNVGNFGITDTNLRPREAWHTFATYQKDATSSIYRKELTATGVGEVQITWNTNPPADSWIEYGLTDSYGQATASTPGSAHTTTIGGLTPGAMYHWRAVSDLGGNVRYGVDKLLYSPDYNCANPGGEDGFEGQVPYGWYGFGPGRLIDGSRVDPSTVRSGSHCQQVVANGACDYHPIDDVYWQQEAVGAGRGYTFHAYTRLDCGGTSIALWRRVGTDPTGGTDRDSPNIVWSSSSYTEGYWLHQTASATAASDVVTVFWQVGEGVRQDYLYLATMEDVWVELHESAPAGRFDAGWQLWSLPLSPNSSSVASVLADLTSAGNTLTNNVVRWDGAYQTYPTDFGNIERGRAYWTRVDYPATCTVSGTGEAAPVYLPLLDGWSMIGCPQLAAVPLSSCRVKVGPVEMTWDQAVTTHRIFEPVFGYDGDGYGMLTSGAGDSLEPWHGYWLLANGPGMELVVPHP